MKKKLLIVFSSIVIIGMLILIITVKKESDIVPEYVLTYAENHPEDYPTTLGGYKFAELVEERTDGRIKIIVRAGAIMGDEKDVVEQLRFGGIDFTRASLSSLGDLIPELNVLQMPFLYEDSQHMWRVLDGEIGNYFMDAFTGSNLVALAWYDAGARNFYTRNKAITCLEDMQGMKIRVQEAQLMMDLIEALGAIPVPTTYREVYSELEIGNIEGAENNWPSYESSDHYEVATYYTIDEHTRVPEVQLCSQILWNKDRKSVV